VPSLGGYDALNNWGIRWNFTAGTSQPGRGNCFTLGTVDGGPDVAIHSVKGYETPTGVAHRNAYLDVEFIRLCYSCLNNPVRFS
jgi:hypothetical protein